MRVVSVNIGEVRQVVINGRAEPTAFRKTPVSAPVEIMKHGLRGDRLGTPRSLGKENHAVYLYPVEHYATWQRDLSRTGLPCGSFGENLTVEGIDETRLRIGDMLVVGTARLRVIQPRIPCYKLAHFLDAPQNFPARFLQSARVGAYCAVIREGVVQAGDSIELVPADPANLTIAEFVRLTHFDTNDVPGLAALLDSPDLIEGWRERVDKLLTRAMHQGGNPGSWSGWRQLRCVDRVAECEDVQSFHLAGVESGPLAPCRPGQFLTVRVDIGDGQQLIRTYTISGAYPSFDNPDRYRITVKRGHRDEAAPSASAALHARVVVGGVVDARSPTGAFSLALASERPIVFVSSGIGITPMMAMLQALADARDTRELVFVHGARSGRVRPFARHVASLRAALPGLNVCIFHSRPEPEERIGVDFDRHGRVTAEAVLAPAGRDAAYFLCGPSTFMRDIADGLIAAGVDRASIHAEAFGSSALLPVDPSLTVLPPAERAVVRLERSGITLAWTAEDGTLLDLLGMHDVAVEASCRSGICQTCAARIVSGSVAYPPGISSEGPSQVLLCSARPAGDLVLDL